MQGQAPLEEGPQGVVRLAILVGETCCSPKSVHEMQDFDNRPSRTRKTGAQRAAFRASRRRCCARMQEWARPSWRRCVASIAHATARRTIGGRQPTLNQRGSRIRTRSEELSSIERRNSERFCGLTSLLMRAGRARRSDQACGDTAGALLSDIAGAKPSGRDSRGLGCSSSYSNSS